MCFHDGSAKGHTNGRCADEDLRPPVLWCGIDGILHAEHRLTLMMLCLDV